MRKARRRVDTPVTRFALAAAAAGTLDELLGPLAVATVVRLLDAAHLLGAPAAAEHLAARCEGSWPLRIWGVSDLVLVDYMKVRLNINSTAQMQKYHLCEPLVVEALARSGIDSETERCFTEDAWVWLSACQTMGISGPVSNFSRLTLLRADSSWMLICGLPFFSIM